MTVGDEGTAPFDCEKEGDSICIGRSAVAQEVQLGDIDAGLGYAQLLPASRLVG